MLHTIQEAIQLAGVSRRTLYNHSDAGRISYSPGPDGRRRFETAELERVYGKLAHPSAQQLAHIYTPHPPASDDLVAMVEAAVARATAPLIEEINQLRETLLRIEHKPEPTKPTPAQDKAQAPQSIADILASWE